MHGILERFATADQCQCYYLTHIYSSMWQLIRLNFKYHAGPCLSYFNGTQVNTSFAAQLGMAYGFASLLWIVHRDCLLGDFAKANILSPYKAILGAFWKHMICVV